MKKTSPGQGAGSVEKSSSSSEKISTLPASQAQAKSIAEIKGEKADFEAKLAIVKKSGIWRAALPIHSAANKLRELTVEEVHHLGGDLKRHGQREPVVLVRIAGGVQQLIDGRNRLDLQEAGGIKVVDDDGNLLVEHRIVDLPDDNAALLFVLSLNLYRRHLDLDDRRKLLRDVLVASPEKSNRQIGKIVGLSHPVVAADRKKLEVSGDVEMVSTSTDTKGRQQPRARKKAAIKTSSVLPSKEEKKEETGSPAITMLPATEPEPRVGRELEGLRADVARLKRENIALLSEVEDLQEAKTAASIDAYIIDLAQQDKKVRALTLYQIMLRLGLSLSDLANAETEPVAGASS